MLLSECGDFVAAFFSNGITAREFNRERKRRQVRDKSPHSKSRIVQNAFHQRLTGAGRRIDGG
jgi:hypothetical protein